MPAHFPCAQAWQKAKEALPPTKEFAAAHGVTGTHIGSLAGTHTSTGTGTTRTL